MLVASIATAAPLNVYQSGNANYVLPADIMKLVKGRVEPFSGGVKLIWGKSTLKFTAGSRTVYLNGQGYMLNAAPITRNKTLYLPYADTFTLVAPAGQIEAVGYPLPAETAAAPSVPVVKSPPPAPAAVPVAEAPYRLIEGADGSAAFDLLAYGRSFASSMGPLTADSVFRLCQEFVLSDLKAPATARFAASPIVSRYTNGVWDMWGQVDAQNGYGALVRSSYTCIFQVSGGMFKHYIDINTRR